MNTYFRHFPTIEYPYLGKMVNSKFSSTVSVTDLSIRFRLINRILASPSSYYEYSWKDGERPDQVAFNYYGDSNLSWIVMLSANIYDWVYDVPMTDSVFYDYLKDKYETDDVDSLMSSIHHYEDSEGYILDLAGYIASGDVKKRVVSIFDFEYNENIRRREVKLISKAYVKEIMVELYDQLSYIKNTRRELEVM